MNHSSFVRVDKATCNVAASEDGLPVSHIGQIRSPRPSWQTRPSAYGLPESPFYTVDGTGTVCTTTSRDYSQLPHSQQLLPVQGPYLPHPEIFEVIAYGQHHVEQTKALTTSHNSAFEHQGITNPHRPIHLQREPAVEVTSADHTLPPSCVEPVPSITPASSPSKPSGTTNNTNPRTPAFIHQSSKSDISYPNHNKINIIPYQPLSRDEDTTTHPSRRVHIGTPHFFPPIENDMTIYERKMLYMKSLERYVIHLHQHLIAIGVTPPQIEKTTKTRKMSAMALQMMVAYLRREETLARNDAWSANTQ
ncbi:hypothetical protein CVT26_012948, partial [Gymnopilus dilepis]